jgi:sugar O-acyltransferase (sialic acid O-acetyltransferase NeuD family)
MKHPLFIYGAGGLGREILSLVLTLQEYEVKGFFDDGLPKGSRIKGAQVLGGVAEFNELPEDNNVIFALGDPLLKQKLIAKIKRPFRYPVLIHPSATIQDIGSVTIGEGSIICAGACITCDITIGKHVLVNLNSTIGHDTTIGSYSSIMPGVNIAGEVVVGESILLGSGCSIRNRVTIGNAATVGMGAVVLNDVAIGKTVAGVPAREIKS